MLAGIGVAAALIGALFVSQSALAAGSAGTIGGNHAARMQATAAATVPATAVGETAPAAATSEPTAVGTGGEATVAAPLPQTNASPVAAGGQTTTNTGTGTGTGTSTSLPSTGSGTAAGGHTDAFLIVVALLALGGVAYRLRRTALR